MTAKGLAVGSRLVLARDAGKPLQIEWLIDSVLHLPIRRKQANFIEATSYRSLAAPIS